MKDKPQELSKTLAGLAKGDSEAAVELFPIVYEELKRFAAKFLGAGASKHTLQPTALVHEVFLRLVDQTNTTLQSRAHFMALSSRIMRQILVDHARRNQAHKRGRNWKRISLAEAEGDLPLAEIDVLALDEALNKLAELNPRHAQMVEMRFLGGLSVDETAAVLDVSPRTVKSDWRLAKAWLARELKRGDEQ
jgi:RNA polymerase sigma-70 factor, ECF subfamily